MTKNERFGLVFLKTGSINSGTEFIDPVFAKTSPKRSFSVIQNERFGLVFANTGSIISGTDWGVVFKYCNCVEDEISMFSYPKSGHIRWKVFTKSVEFAKVECSLKAY
jgi:hypothetical protein